jgi:hypothetical protein
VFRTDQQVDRPRILRTSIPACVRVAERTANPRRPVEGCRRRRSTLPHAVHQRFELALATLIETDDLAIEHGALDVHTCSDVLGQFSESFVDVPLA